MFKLDGKQQFSVWNALHVARTRYEEDAKHARQLSAEAKARGDNAVCVGWERIADQFDAQVAEAEVLIEIFE
jgi:hypothetical protein